MHLTIRFRRQLAEGVGWVKFLVVRHLKRPPSETGMRANVMDGLEQNFRFLSIDSLAFLASP